MANKSQIIITAKDKTKTAFRSVRQSVNDTETQVKALGAALAVVAGATGLALATKKALELSDKMDKLAIRLGTTTEALSVLEGVALAGGVSFETFAMGMQRATRRIAEAAQGTGEAKGALMELGLSAESLNRLDMPEKFKTLAEAISKVESPADQVRLAMKLFDSEGVALIQTMKGGAAGVQALEDRFKSMGIVLDTDLTKAAAAANTELDILNLALRNKVTQAFALLGPEIETIVKLLNDELGSWDSKEFGDTLSNAFRNIAIAGAAVIDVFIALGQVWDLLNVASSKLHESLLQVQLGLLKAKEAVNPFSEAYGAEIFALEALIGAVQDRSEKLFDTFEQSALKTSTVEDITEAFAKMETNIQGASDALEAFGGAGGSVGSGSGSSSSGGGITAVKTAYEDILGSTEGLLAANEALNVMYAEQVALLDSQKEVYVDVLGSAEGLQAANEAANEQFKKGLDEQEAALKKATEQYEKIWDNMVDNMQRNFADTIYGVLFEEGISSFQDFGDAIVDIFKRAIAEMVAAWAASKIASFISGGFGAPSGGGGSVVGNIVSGIPVIGPILGGLFHDGGISRGPESGYRPMLHGNEAVIPLGNGDRIKAPVVIQGGGGDQMLAKEVRRLTAAIEVQNRRAA